MLRVGFQYAGSTFKLGQELIVNWNIGIGIGLSFRILYRSEHDILYDFMLCELLYSGPNGSTGVELWYSPESLASEDKNKQVTHNHFSHAGVHLSWDAAGSTPLGKSAVVQWEASLQSDTNSIYADQDERLHNSKVNSYE